MEDIALTPSLKTPGKHTFVWDEEGDLVFNKTQAYPVLASVLARKGTYRWDEEYGTHLYLVKSDNRTTGSRLAAYASDGMQALADVGIVQTYRVEARRVRTGSWSMRIEYSAGGAQRSLEVDY